MRRTLGWTLMIVMALSLAAAAGDVNVEIVDQTSHVVRVEQPVERVVSIYGIGTYYVYALGASARLVLAGYVGLKSYSQATATMLRFEPRLEELVTSGDPSVEEMIALETDLILVDGSRHADFALQMTDLGVPVVSYLVETADAMIEAARITGAALGAEAAARAEAFVGDLERILDTIADDVADVPEADRPQVLFVGTSSLRVATGGMFQTEWIERAGGVSVTRDLSGYWSDVNLEQILLWDPEIIIIAPYGTVQPSDLLDNPDWQAVRAVRDGHVVRMPRLLGPIDTPVPEALIGLLWMAETFHPESLSLDVRAEIERFYEIYYGLTLTEEELESLLPQ